MLIVSLLPCLLSLSQDTVVVVEKSIKVAAMSSMTEYYGFAEGDKVVFNFWVEKGKELKDIIISEYPSASLPRGVARAARSYSGKTAHAADIASVAVMITAQVCVSYFR